jgi:hypothetical protein
MLKLNDTQTILLSVASRRDDLAVHPLEDAQDGRRPRHQGDRRADQGRLRLKSAGRCAIFATLAGLAAIGVDLGQGGRRAGHRRPRRLRLARPNRDRPRAASS